MSHPFEGHDTQGRVVYQHHSVFIMIVLITCYYTPFADVIKLKYGEATGKRCYSGNDEQKGRFDVDHGLFHHLIRKGAHFIV
ncbi:hypothetical protein [Lentibacillus kimchii]|uniref:Uncharacterized protein n=1 Tax=Lentibacillus kimchii TaxID=1542911 RepID=A0ABW2UTZ0_9BACI